MSQLAAVDISDSDRFELAEVLKEESESSSAPRLLEDILQETWVCRGKSAAAYSFEYNACIAALKVWNTRYIDPLSSHRG